MTLHQCQFAGHLSRFGADAENWPSGKEYQRVRVRSSQVHCFYYWPSKSIILDLIYCLNVITYNIIIYLISSRDTCSMALNTALTQTASFRKI